MTMQPYEAAEAGVIEHYRAESRGVRRLRDWAEEADAAHRVAKMLVVTSFVPVHYRDKPAEAAAAILAGSELGFDPIASLNAFYPIQGTSAPKALTLRAVVQGKGHEFELVESTPQRCIMRGRRRGAENWQQVTWSLERARQLGLTSRDQWRKQPQAMLVARATSELARLIGADALMGIPYSYEELQDTGPDEEVAEVATAGRPARARRRTAAAIPGPERPAEPRPPAARPPLPSEVSAPVADESGAKTGPEHAESSDESTAVEGAPDTETVDESGEVDVNDPRMKRLFALLHKAEVTDRFAFATAVLGWKVETFKRLKVADVYTLVRALEEDLAQDAKGTDDGEH
jgi:hypothetical protein